MLVINAPFQCESTSIILIARGFTIAEMFIILMLRAVTDPENLAIGDKKYIYVYEKYINSSVS
jgi:hypothetical protein